jgi:translation initiation factor 4A
MSAASASSSSSPVATPVDSDFIVETSGDGEFPRCPKFDDMPLPESLLRGVYSYGFEKPSAIQSVAITPLIAGRDILGQAQSGTGKTGAFGIGCLARIDPKIRGPQAIIVCHSHELADQTAKVLRDVATYMKISIVLAIGGVPRHQNVRDIRAAPCIVVGTPGRIFDLAYSGDLPYDSLRTFIVDEADELLRDRFLDQVNDIVRIGLPSTCTLGLFSATLPEEVAEMADKILTKPVKVTLRMADVKLDGIKQFGVELEDDSQKISVLADIFQSISIPHSIIFTNTKERADRLHYALTQEGFPVSVIYGDPMPQAERKTRMDQFRSGESRVLIATNLLARGIDVQTVSMVFNFDVPSFEDKESYIHRIGRCGRYGRKGTAINLLTAAEKDVLDQIAAHYSFEVKPLPMDLSGVLPE